MVNPLAGWFICRARTRTTRLQVGIESSHVSLARCISRLARFFAGSHLRKEPRRAAELPFQRFIADEPRALGMIFQHELARMKCFELGAMAHTDDGGFRESLQHQLHQRCWLIGSERRSPRPSRL